MSDQVIDQPARIATARETVPPGHAVDDQAVRSSYISRKILLALGGLVIVGAVSGYGYSWWTTGRFFKSTNDAFVGGNVTVIASRIAGFIQSVDVSDNEIVHAGQLLLKLDDRDYRAALARAEANVAGAQAAILNLDATRKLQQAVISETQADLLSAAAEVARTDYDVQRYSKLSRDQYASQQQFQQADAAYRRAIATNDKARAAVDAATAQLAVIDTQKMQAQASLAAAKADLDAAKLNLSYTEIRAPIDGAIGNRSAQAGSYATPGANLISLVPARGLWVDANFKEDQLAAMRAGLPVTVRADVLPGHIFHGKVESIAPATGAQFSVLPAENATGNFTKIVQRVPVRIALDSDESSLGLLRPGLSVTADVDERSENWVAGGDLLLASLWSDMSAVINFRSHGEK